MPIHPETKADLDRVIKIESEIDFGGLFEKAMENTTNSTIYHPDYINEKEKKLVEIYD